MYASYGLISTFVQPCTTSSENKTQTPCLGPQDDLMFAANLVDDVSFTVCLENNSIYHGKVLGIDIQLTMYQYKIYKGYGQPVLHNCLSAPCTGRSGCLAGKENWV